MSDKLWCTAAALPLTAFPSLLTLWMAALAMRLYILRNGPQPLPCLTAPARHLLTWKSLTCGRPLLLLNPFLQCIHVLLAHAPVPPADRASGHLLRCEDFPPGPEQAAEQGRPVRIHLLAVR
eukprot:1158344-Pelagomonas_calceolata.AAC.6